MEVGWTRYWTKYVEDGTFRQKAKWRSWEDSWMSEGHEYGVNIHVCKYTTLNSPKRDFRFKKCCLTWHKTSVQDCSKKPVTASPLISTWRNGALFLTFTTMALGMWKVWWRSQFYSRRKYQDCSFKVFGGSDSMSYKQSQKSGGRGEEERREAVNRPRVVLIWKYKSRKNPKWEDATSKTSPQWRPSPDGHHLWIRNHKRVFSCTGGPRLTSPFCSVINQNSPTLTQW